MGYLSDTCPWDGTDVFTGVFTDILIIHSRHMFYPDARIVLVWLTSKVDAWHKHVKQVGRVDCVHPNNLAHNRYIILSITTHGDADCVQIMILSISTCVIIS